MSVFRCERVAAGDFDHAVASLGEVTLARRPDGAFVEVADARDADLVRALAFAGVRVSRVDVMLEPPSAMRPAIGRDLGPLPLAALALDLVHVRTLPLVRETRRLLRMSFLRRSSARRRLLGRRLLHGEDATVSWRRRAWSTPEVLRSSAARRALRPVVFDVGALAAPPERRIHASDAALAHWLFA
jgi:hypothetical protein